MNECLYRFFDENGTLLYVGITKDWPNRLKAHYKADFYSAVQTMTLERYPDRESVAAAEIKAIEQENPIYNRLDNPNYRTWQTHFRQLIDWAKGKEKPDQNHKYVIEKLLLGAGPLEDRFTGRWIARHYPPEWYEAVNSGLLDCDLCDDLVTHKTVSSWGYQEEEL